MLEKPQKIDGYCICPSCGERVPHLEGNPCFRSECPKCKSFLERDHSDNQEEATISEDYSLENGESVDEFELEEQNLPRVDKEECISCGICIDECPENAIVFKSSYAFILNDRCNDCGICLRVCPQDAIARKN